MKYTIAATVRTASSTLCDELCAHGIGKPLEYGIPKFLDEGIVPETVNGICGANIMWGQLNKMRDHVKDSDKIIYLYRRDIVKQAVSWLLALQTGSYSYREIDGTDTPLVYDFPKLHKLVNHLSISNNNWKKYLKDASIEYLELATEDFLSDRPFHIKRICEFLGVEAPTEFGIGTNRIKQEYPEKNEWYRRYFESLKGGDTRNVSGFDYDSVDHHYDPIIL